MSISIQLPFHFIYVTYSSVNQTNTSYNTIIKEEENDNIHIYYDMQKNENTFWYILFLYISFISFSFFLFLYTIYHIDIES